MKIVTKEGDEIKVRDAIGNFINSPAFQVRVRERERERGREGEGES